MTKKTKGGDFHGAHRGEIENAHARGKTTNLPETHRHHQFFKRQLPKHKPAQEVPANVQVTQLALVVAALDAAVPRM
jgi:hypothetical protein